MSSKSPIAPPTAFGAPRIGTTNWYGLWTMYQKETRRFLKVWTQTVAAPCFTTLLFLAIFTMALGGAGRMAAGVDFTSFLAPGLVVMAVLQNAYQNPSSSIMIGKVQGSIVDVLMPPLSAGELMIAYVGGGVTRGLLVGTALALTFWAVPGVEMSIQHLWAVVYFFVSASVMMSLVGVLTGIWAEKFDHTAAIMNFVVTPLSLLSGTFYSITRLPEALQTVSYFNPFFYMIDGFRYGFIGHADGNLMAGVALTLAINTIMWVWGYTWLKTGYNLKP